MTHYQLVDENKISDGVYRTKFRDMFFLPHSYFPDERGFFKEITRVKELEVALDHPFVVKQINHSRSGNNVVRGFHAEAWNKLVTVTHGECLCVLADTRPDSDTFGQTESFLLGAGNGFFQGSIFIPDGVANSICAIVGPVDYLYLVDRVYQDRDQNGDLAISLFDQDLNVEWPISKEAMLISERDKKAVTLRDKFPGRFKGK